MDNKNTQDDKTTYGNITKSAQKNTRKKGIARGVMVVLGALLLIPVIFMGAFDISCNNKIGKLEKQAEQINSVLREVQETKPYVTGEARRNGDCVTGSGVTLNLEANTRYEGLVHADKDISDMLEQLGLVALSVEPWYVSSKDQNAVSGGDSDIVTVEYARESKRYQYYYSMLLASPVGCEMAQEVVVCDGATPRKEVLTMEYLSKKPVVKSVVSVHIKNPDL